jgi:hypothetical protein
MVLMSWRFVVQGEGADQGQRVCGGQVHIAVQACLQGQLPPFDSPVCHQALIVLQAKYVFYYLVKRGALSSDGVNLYFLQVCSSSYSISASVAAPCVFNGVC